MNVVICDDDPLFISKLKSILEPIFAEEYPSANFFEFNSGSDLLTWYIQEGSNIDILYIDVEMPGYTGLEIMHMLRRQNCNCLTIFISYYQSYVFDSFDYDVMNYLLKPLDTQKVLRTTLRVLNRYYMVHQKIRINSSGRRISLTIDSIITIEKECGKLLFHTTIGDFYTSGNLNFYEMTLMHHNFLRSYKSFLINMDYVLYYEKHKFHLINNLTADISHTRRSSIISKYKTYLEDREF